jgi:hypothetical protein
MNLETGKPFSVCKWRSLVHGRAKGEFFKIVQQKSMSELRLEIEDSINEFLWEEEILLKGEKVRQDEPLAYLKLSPEGELKLLIFIEKTWKCRFSDEAAEEFAKNSEVGTMANLITIIIKLMNGQ